MAVRKQVQWGEVRNAELAADSTRLYVGSP
jgi:hypothetical protein